MEADVEDVCPDDDNNRGELQLLKGLAPVALVIIAACSFQQGPSLVEPDTPAAVVVEPTSTPSPDDLMNGRWVSIISETKSHEFGDLKIDVKQLRFSMPSRLLPDLTSEQLTEIGIAGVPTVIAVRINVENTGSEAAEFNPSGFGNVLTVSGVETRPIFALTGEAVSLAAGEKEGFLIVFPVTLRLGEFQELMFTVRGESFSYSELGVHEPR